VPDQIPGLLLRGELLPDVGGPLGRWKDASVYANDAVQTDPAFWPEEVNQSVLPYMGSMFFDSLQNLPLKLPFPLQGDYLLNTVALVGPAGHPLPVFPKQFPFGRQGANSFALQLENDHVAIGVGAAVIRVLVPLQAELWHLWQLRRVGTSLALYRNGVQVLSTGPGFPGAILFTRLGGDGNGIGHLGLLHASCYPWGVSDDQFVAITGQLLSDYSAFVSP